MIATAYANSANNPGRTELDVTMVSYDSLQHTSHSTNVSLEIVSNRSGPSYATRAVKHNIVALA